LELNEKNKEASYTLLCAINYEKNMKMMKLLMEYAKNNKIILKLNEHDISNIYKISNAFIEIIIEYENAMNLNYYFNNSLLKRKIKLNNLSFNETFMLACCEKDIEMIKLLIEKSNKKEIILNLSVKNKEYINEILLESYSRKDIDMINLLHDFLIKNETILKLNIVVISNIFDILEDSEDSVKINHSNSIKNFDIKNMENNEKENLIFEKRDII